jgi:integrase
MFAYAADELDLRDSNPVHKVKRKKTDDFEPVLLDADQYEAFLTECQSRGEMVWMYALLLGETGMRSMSESLWLRWGDVDLRDGWTESSRVATDTGRRPGKGATCRRPPAYYRRCGSTSRSFDSTSTSDASVAR